MPHLKHEDLLAYFHEPAENRLVGAELELAGYDLTVGRPITYSGERGVGAVLGRIAARGWEPSYEGEHIIGLTSSEGAFTIEPGGQLELSTPPREDASMIAADTSALRDLVHEVSGDLGIGWIAVGLNPVSTWEEVELVPKHRYDVMTAYLRERGGHALDMMRRTQSVHVTYDYEDEAEVTLMARVANLATPVVAGIFANSPIEYGRENGWHSRRALIWRDVDPDRCGLDKDAVEGTWSFDRYLERLLDIPLIFVVNDGVYHAAEGIPAREYFANGFDGHEPVVEDLEWVINQTFPDVRIRHYIESRGCDMPPVDLVPAIAAIWLGLLYDEQARDGVIEMLGDLGWGGIQALQLDVARYGLQAEDSQGRKAQELAAGLLEHARNALVRRGRGEETLLDAVIENVDAGKTPADLLLEAWRTDLSQDPRKLIAHLQV